MSKGRLAIEAAALSRAGNAHPAGTPGGNWDAATCLPSLESPEPPAGFDLIAVVADGVSSTAQGGKASRAAVRAAARWVQKAFADVPPERLRGYRDRDLDDLLANVVRRTHDAVVQQAPDGHTTLALACVRDGRLFCANLGDSRIYQWREGTLRQLSEDHHSANGITRWVGGAHAEPAPAVRVGEPIREGDVLILCTDGINALYGDEELAQLAEWVSRHPLAETWPQLAADVEARMRAPAYVDDTTLVLARVPAATEEKQREKAPETKARPRAVAAPAAPQAEGERVMTETREAERLGAAIEELTAAVRLLRTHLATEREESGARRRSGSFRPERLVFSLAPLVLLLGVALGLIGGHLYQQRGAAQAAAKPRAFSLNIKPPDDLGTILAERVEGEVYHLTYTTPDGSKRKTLLYHTRGNGEPYGKVVVPLPAAPTEVKR